MKLYWRWLIAVCLTFAPVLASRVLAQAPAAAQAVVRVGMTVDDLDRSVRFFSEMLDFEKVSEREAAGRDLEQLTGIFGARTRIAVMRLGEEEIELTEYVTGGGREVPRDSRSNDRWFQHIAVITSDMEKAYERLRSRHVKYASSGPQRLPDSNPNAGGIRAFYFKDPDRHVIEILQFPPGKGQQRWQSKKPLFLGIDHTAIVVSDTEKSLAFYAGALGLKTIGRSENFGDEQEHLNNVFGARVRITTLSAGQGPAIEFLEYLAPTSGRPCPDDARPNDVFHWQTIVSVKRPDDLFASMKSDRWKMVSAGVAETDLKTRAFIVRDPDGHAVEISSETKP